MNDRFKFRYFENSTSLMGNIFSFDLESNYAQIDDRQNQNYFPFREVKLSDGILMQSTGLKDQNGKLIYEGDILSCDNESAFGIVQWNLIGLEWELFNPDNVYHDDDGCCEGDGICNFYFYEIYEVVGNIHENDDFEFSISKRYFAKKN
jgi:uncharacterized phage protein (TIGR01671 family)